MQNACHIYSLPSRNAVRKHNVRVGQLHALLDRIQCIRLSGPGEMHGVSVKTRSGERMHRLPSQNVTDGSDSDRFDIEA